MAIQVVAAVIGAFIVLATGWSVLGTLVVPRRIRSRIPRMVFIVNRSVFHFVADKTSSYERRDRILAVQAPVQLIGQVVAWLALYQLGFGLLMWPFVGNGDLGSAMEQAGSALCTLGFLVPHTSGGAALDPLAALAGLGTVALQIGYLPTLYAAFNRREALITMLDSRAGVPSWGPELLARTHYGLGSGVSAVGELPELFEAWEQWSADVSESHTTYVATDLVPLAASVVVVGHGAACRPRRRRAVPGAASQRVRPDPSAPLSARRLHLSRATLPAPSGFLSR